ncbi:hypothetical protein ACFPRL_29380 [Pseudoclavibacter helvolus]
MRESDREGGCEEHRGQAENDDEHRAEAWVAEPVEQLHPEQDRDRANSSSAEHDGARLCGPPDDRHEDEAHDHADEQQQRYRYLWVLQEVVEADGHVLLEQHCHEEDRQRVREEGQERDRVVVARVLPKRGRDADGDTDHDGDERRGGDELQGLANRCGDERANVLAHDVDAHGEVVAEEAEQAVRVVEGRDEEPEDAAEPQEESCGGWHIQLQELHARGDELLLVGSRGLQDVRERVLRDRDEVVHDEERAQQDEDRHEEASEGESQHRWVLFWRRHSAGIVAANRRGGSPAVEKTTVLPPSLGLTARRSARREFDAGVTTQRLPPVPTPRRSRSTGARGIRA